ncbi:hypothetical protein CDAR_588771 [Caerostris darwini]|uniref:Uncharacterized protein n=1 Tax=Caerostris darwini TaxID=1538125 RepID=A0AAV4UUY9_9ARAC|nr:hypothetical protein CDAR_588771 [Caerostris darwini]
MDISQQLSTDGLSVARRYVNIQFKEVSAVEETGAVKNEFTFFLKTILDRMRLPRASPQTVRTFRFQDEPNLIPRPSSA